MSSLLYKVNWVDIIFLTLLLRISYIGLRRGFVVEFFKGLGIFTSLFISLHYYSKLAGFISQRTSVSIKFSEPFFFLFLIILSVLVFKFIRDGLLLVFKIEPKSFLDKSGAVFLGLIRGILIISLILLAFRLTGIEYLQKSISDSFTGIPVIKVAPGVYKFSFEKIMGRLFPKEELNKAIFEDLNSLKPNSRATTI